MEEGLLQCGNQARPRLHEGRVDYSRSEYQTEDDDVALPALSCNKEQAQDTQINLLVARNAPYNAPMIDPFWTWKPLILLRKPRNAFRLELTWDHCSILHSVTIQLQNKAGRWVMVGASHSRKTLLFRFSIC